MSACTPALTPSPTIKRTTSDDVELDEACAEVISLVTTPYSSRTTITGRSVLDSADRSIGLESISGRIAK